MHQPPLGHDPNAPDTTRLLLTVVICTGLFLVWSNFFAPHPVPPSSTAAAGDAIADSTGGPIGPGSDAPKADPVGAETVDPAAVAATKDDLPEVTHSLSTDVVAKSDQPTQGVRGGYRAVVSTHGAQIGTLELTGYGDPTRKDPVTGQLANIDLVRSTHEGAKLFGLKSRGGDVALSVDAPYETVSSTAHDVTLERLTASGVRVTRAYSFDQTRFGFQHKLTLHNEGTAPRTAALDLVLVGVQQTSGESSFFAPQVDDFSVACRTADSQEKFQLDDLAEGEQHVTGAIDHAAVGWQYFLAAVVPGERTQVEGCTARQFAARSDSTVPAEKAKSGIALSLHHSAITLAPGESVTLEHTAYVGPKQLGMLQDEGHALDENIDFGIFGVLSRPILWALVKLFDFSGNFGIAIILLTMLIKLLTFPLTQKSYVSMQQMKTIAPEMKALQQKFGHDRTQLGQKQMELYKERGINPMAGCLPILIQMPIWFALYRTLWTSVELYQQPFVGFITDLSQPEVFPLLGFAVLPFFVGALMLFQTTLQPPPDDQPQMKYVMYAMPVIFTAFMFGMPSGLSIYMITNSVLTMAQQLYIKKKYSN